MTDQAPTLDPLEDMRREAEKLCRLFDDVHLDEVVIVEGQAGVYYEARFDFPAQDERQQRVILIHSLSWADNREGMILLMRNLMRETYRCINAD